MQKVKNTTTFYYRNANPKNKKTTDCFVRAISTAMEQDYETTARELLDMWMKTGYCLNDPKCYGAYLESKGWVKHKQPRHSYDNTKYTGRQFCLELVRYDSDIDSGNDMNHIIAHIGGHHIVAIICGQIYDIWNSEDKCIGNYWTKG